MVKSVVEVLQLVHQTSSLLSKGSAGLATFSEDIGQEDSLCGDGKLKCTRSSPGQVRAAD